MRPFLGQLPLSRFAFTNESIPHGRKTDYPDRWRRLSNEVAAHWRDLTQYGVIVVNSEVASTRQDISVTTRAKILCVESDSAVLETRCAVLKYSGYDAASASPQAAEIVLRSRKFDLLVISSLSDSDLNRVVNLSDGGAVLVLEELTLPDQLLSLVAERLNHRQRRA